MQSERKGPKGTVLPSTCKVGDEFILVDRANGLTTKFICVVDNAWFAVYGNDPTQFPVTQF